MNHNWCYLLRQFAFVTNFVICRTFAFQFPVSIIQTKQVKIDFQFIYKINYKFIPQFKITKRQYKVARRSKVKAKKWMQ